MALVRLEWNRYIQLIVQIKKKSIYIEIKSGVLSKVIFNSIKF